MKTVAIVGAGVIGASIAYRLAESGIEVTVLERGEAGGGTSGASFAWTNANQKHPRDYFDLNVHGMREHARLIDELGPAPWFNPGGNLWWTGDPNGYDQLRARVDRLQTWGYAAEWLHAADVNRDLEPNIHFANANLPVAYFPDEAWIDAPLFARSLLERATASGAHLLEQTAVDGIRLAGGRVEIDVDSEDSMMVDAVVNCAGTSADRIAALVGRRLPLTPSRGLLVIVEPEREMIGRILHTGAVVDLRPDGENRIMLHHDAIDVLVGGRDDVPADDPLCRELVSRARRALPDITSDHIVEVRVGTRPYPRDGRSSFGAVSGLPGYYEAVTHSGVTLAPAIARLLTSEILTGEIDPIAAPFRPDRFG
jgi:glycine/D-amino acid oxidase-like deaminating enzyme